MRENVGIQDQIACAYGGLNRIDITQEGAASVRALRLSPYKKQRLEEYMLLFFTGVSRTASDIAADQIQMHKEGRKEAELRWMQESVQLGQEMLESSDMVNFGALLHESWQIKRSLVKNIAPQFVDDIYEKARKAGAMGGKLLGAGGGGFMLIFAHPEEHWKIHTALKGLVHVPFQLEDKGSQIIYTGS